MKRFKHTVGTLCLALSLTGTAALAWEPEKPIEIIVGYSAGGGTDVMARTAAPFIEKYLGEGASLVVKNMPGASGQSCTASPRAACAVSVTTGSGA